MQRELERRFVTAEFRADSPDGAIEGYAAVFNAQSEDLGGFREKIRPGAFAKTIAEADVRALFNHDANYVLGRNRAGTLELAEDDHGLLFRVTPPATGWAADLRASISRGDIDQASFGFWVVRDEWRNADTGRERELVEVALLDVSVVTYPAYPQTQVTARSMNDVISALRSMDVTADELRALIDQITTMLPAAPVQVDHPATAAAASVAQVRQAMRRRRLQLAQYQL